MFWICYWRYSRSSSRSNERWSVGSGGGGITLIIVRVVVVRGNIGFPLIGNVVRER